MFKKLIMLLLCMLVLAACSLGATDDRNTDAEAAQSFLPTIAGYDVRSVDFAQDAIANALQGAGALTGNVIGAALVNRFNTLVNCYQERGALDARLYTQRLDVVLQGQVPIAGFLAVVNLDRVEDNFVSCATQNPLGDAFSAQAAQPEPCVGTGSFIFNDNRITFVFAATDQPLCTIFAQHFTTYGATPVVSEVQIPGGQR